MSIGLDQSAFEVSLLASASIYDQSIEPAEGARNRPPCTAHSRLPSRERDRTPKGNSTIPRKFMCQGVLHILKSAQTITKFAFLQRSCGDPWLDGKILPSQAKLWVRGPRSFSRASARGPVLELLGHQSCKLVKAHFQMNMRKDVMI